METYDYIVVGAGSGAGGEKVVDAEFEEVDDHKRSQ